MTELFTKNQQSTDITLERVEHSITGIIDRVEALETGLPTMDQDKLLDDTHEDNHDEKGQVEEKKPYNPPRPPPQRQHHDGQQVHEELPRPLRRPNWQVMGGHPHFVPTQ
jgi:hypothetical protein